MIVENEEPPCKALKQIAIGDIIPQEDKSIEVEVPQVIAALVSADVPNVVQLQTPAATLPSSSVVPLQSAATSSTPIYGQNLQPIFEQDEDEETTSSIIFQKGVPLRKIKNLRIYIGCWSFWKRCMVGIELIIFNKQHTWLEFPLWTSNEKLQESQE
jgi:hypothetical protein